MSNVSSSVNSALRDYSFSMGDRNVSSSTFADRSDKKRYFALQVCPTSRSSGNQRAIFRQLIDCVIVTSQSRSTLQVLRRAMDGSRNFRPEQVANLLCQSMILLGQTSDWPQGRYTQEAKSIKTLFLSGFRMHPFPGEKSRDIQHNLVPSGDRSIFSTNADSCVKYFGIANVQPSHGCPIHIRIINLGASKIHLIEIGFLKVGIGDQR